VLALLIPYFWFLISFGEFESVGLMVSAQSIFSVLCIVCVVFIATAEAGLSGSFSTTSGREGMFEVSVK
jgi:hypothetical protein